MNVDFKFLGLIGVATLASAAALGCMDSTKTMTAASAKATATSAPMKMKSISPVKRSIRREIEIPGVIQADQQSQLFAKLSGYVQKIHADIGTKVKGPKRDAAGRETEPGQLLAELAMPELEAEAKQRRALIELAEAEVEQYRKSRLAVMAGVTVAESTADEAKAGLTRAQSVYERWQGESERVDRLVKTGVIDSQVREETKNQFQAASASRTEAQAHISSASAAILKARADLARTEAEVLTASAKLEVARTEAERTAVMLGYTKIRAPYDGVVTARRVNAGDFLATNTREAAFTIARLDVVRAVLLIPESDAGLIKDNMPIRLTSPGLGPDAVAGKVARTSWALDPASRALRVEVDLPNPDAKLRPGTYLRAMLTAELPPSWTLPISAVTKNPEQSTAMLFAGDQTKRVVVQTGRSDASNIEIRRYREIEVLDSWKSIEGGEHFAVPVDPIKTP